MTTEPDGTERTPTQRIAAGEIVRFSELTPANMAALFPRFADTWLRSQQAIAPVAEGRAA